MLERWIAFGVLLGLLFVVSGWINEDGSAPPASEPEVGLPPEMPDETSEEPDATPPAKRPDGKKSGGLVGGLLGSDDD